MPAWLHVFTRLSWSLTTSANDRTVFFYACLGKNNHGNIICFYPGESLEKRTRFQDAILNVLHLGAFQREIASKKNSYLKHLEKMGT